MKPLLRRLLHLSLTTKLFFLLLPLAFVPLLAVSMQWHFLAKRQITSEVRMRLETRWSFVEQGVKAFVSRKADRIREVAETPLMQDLQGYLEYGLIEETASVQERIREFFTRLMQDPNDTAIHRICLVAPSKNLALKVTRHSTTPKGEKGVDGCPRQGLIPPAEMTSQGPDKEIQDRFLRLSIPVLDRWQRIWGQLTFDMPFKELAEMMAHLPLPEDGAGIILDDVGRVVACTDTNRLPSESGLCSNIDILFRLIARIMEDHRPNPHGEIADGHVLFIGVLPVQEGWRIALAVPLERYERTVRQLGWTSVLAGFLFFGIAIAVLLPLTRRATAPLRRLEEHARQISTGDFHQKLSDSAFGLDEIGKLARAFNMMVDSLSIRDLRLRQQAEILTARNEELVTLNRVVKRAASTLQLGDLLPALLDEILSAMGLKIGVIRLLDETRGNLYLAAYRGLDEEYAKNAPCIPLGEEMTGKVALTGEPVFMPDVQNDPMHHHLLARVHSDEPMRGFAAVPIVAQTQIIGTLAFGSTGSRTFNQTDLASLISIGVGIGACIRNAHLHHELSEAYERLRTLQDHLIRTEKLSAMGQLIAGVAHEISNPLTTIMGYAQLLQGELDNPEIRDQIRTIIEQARRCARVMEKLLAFARETEKKAEVLDLHEVVGEVLEPARLNLVLQGIEIVDRRKMGICFVLADRYQLQQVFLNLITNAQQAVEEKESPRVLEIELDVSECRCIATFSDNGIGMRPEVLRRVFDPFFTTKTHGKGTGLGLSVSYGIVKDHGGEISIESEPGKGTRVRVQLPRASKDAAAVANSNESAGAAAIAWPGRKVLVIDDEPSICRLMEDALHQIQVDVLTAGSVEEARNILRLAAPDLILSDIRLPDGDGFDILDSLALEPGSPWFAFMSGDVVSEETRERLRQSGSECLQKPFEVKDIHKFVSACLQRIEKRTVPASQSVRGQAGLQQTRKERP
ncbi:MAG: GAF domain-containing protein [Candidatus Tectomicrobia bacterium]|uniref:histidine kinase n=1 Tax=Tectimicrobiota bacterium TaxID=2528274 RepID=A0A932HYG3_UNCTE|nr:GAF domain-containing protein [Candidatus Tectomicrobia bacterium]